MKAITIALLLVLATFASAENYAVLVAGSNQFYNYRHQADVCHAYQIVVKHGVNPANIIVMSYNDAAKSPQNPFKGKLFNKPTGSAAGVDVNAGCMIDYEGADVTPENFMAILTGDKAKVKGGNGKVLTSTANDNVFINFVDHGAEGLIAFPSKYLYAPDLLKTLATMETKKMYKQLTFYLETCESGSMFVDLPTNTRVYALSAANPTESSWGTYCPPDDIVGGKHIGSCLGDLFSVNWMEDTDAADVTSRTLQEQFEQVKKLTSQSHVMQWGDLSFTSLAIGEFLGKKKSVSNTFLGKVYKFFQDAQNSVQERSWDQRDAKVQYLLNRFNANPANDDTFTQLTFELDQSKKYASMFQDFSHRYQVSGIYYGSTNFECYQTLIPRVEQQCGVINDYSMGFLKYLYQYCAMYTNWQNATFQC